MKAFIYWLFAIICLMVIISNYSRSNSNMDNSKPYIYTNRSIDQIRSKDLIDQKDLRSRSYNMENNIEIKANTLPEFKKFSKAIGKIESDNRPFIDNSVTARFEYKLFLKLLRKNKFGKDKIKQYIKNYPWVFTVSKGSNDSWKKFNVAKTISWKYAVMSMSLGEYQILGINYKLCEYKDHNEFIRNMKSGKNGQYKSFYSFCKKTGIIPLVTKRDVRAISKKYNGKNYKINEYDKKLKREMKW